MNYNSTNEKILKSLKNNYSMYLQLLKEKKYEELLNKLWDAGYNYLLKDIPFMDYNNWDYILPYDNSVAEKYQLNFINASFVDRFICCQEPKKQYVSHFYDFLNKSDIKLIISLKNNLTFFNDKTVSKVTLDDYFFTVKEYDINGKVYTQINCHSWPDRGILPAEQLEELYLYIKTNYPTEFYGQFNTLVHCWAGVGRTGTFIMYSLLKEMNRKITPEIFLDTLLWLRSQRHLLVESPVQLKFLAEQFIK